MQLPKRKPGKYANSKIDFHITQTKFDELKRNLDQLKKTQPTAAAEVQRLAELGDFSENAAYQMAKGRLRGINQKILELEAKINHAVIIEPKDTDEVALGSKVVIKINGKECTYQILGSAEVDPARGIISRNSPIGAAIMGHKVGDHVEVQQGGKAIACEIIAIK